MAPKLPVRNVRLEVLRPGPPHNQLLSPLTQYLAICGEAGAGVVRLPYEHATFEQRLAALRYEGASEERLSVLRATGIDIARLLASVPGVSGALTGDADAGGAMIHLRITLSASELALLPFELTKVPTTIDGTSEAWLTLQTRPPVCITRHIRTVSTEGVHWPLTPRILFVAGSTGDIPFADHLRVLEQAIAPFQYPARDDPRPGRDPRHTEYGELLTVIKDASLDDVVTACRVADYTHVHVLAHGAVDMASRDRAFGLRLPGRRGGTDLVSGERFATALATVDGARIHRPAVVSLASCDSGLVANVVDPVPASSFAHTLHQSGIPLVVASQFPLTKEGSITVATILYSGLLAGEAPWVLLHRLRSELHARYGAESHDWASLVVYEAFPSNIDEQMETLRYRQGRVRLNAALERLDVAVRERPGEDRPRAADDDEFARVQAAMDALPDEGPYQMECLGLRAGATKRLAQAEYARVSQRAPGIEPDLVGVCERLEQAVSLYQQAGKLFVLNAGGAVQRVATLHWVLVQEIGLRAVLGQPLERGLWEAARYAAEAYLDHPDPDERAWAHGSLAELHLLRLAMDPQLSKSIGSDADAAAQFHARALARLYPSGDPFPITATRRQLRRYVEWWSDERFAACVDRPRRWNEDQGVRATAGALVNVLQRRFQPGEEAQPVNRPAAQTEVSAAVAAPVVTTREPVPGPAPDAPPQPAQTRRPGRDQSFFDIHMLPAQHGDCLWIEYGEDPRATSRVLIDCGTRGTSRHLMGRIGQLPPADRSVELFVLTHIDDDHIGGSIPFLEGELGGLSVGDVWFNGWKHLSELLGAIQGERFSTLIEDLHLPWNRWREGEAIVVERELPVHVLPGGMRLTLLSPTARKLQDLGRQWKKEVGAAGLTPGQRIDGDDLLGAAADHDSTDVAELAARPFKTDTKAPNGSSIAFLAEFAGRAVLFGADAHPAVLVESLKTLLQSRGGTKLRLSALKVPHHASHGNTSPELIRMLECSKYLISTNGDRFRHPHRETISRLIKLGVRNPQLLFNYVSKDNGVWSRPDLQEQHGYTTVYPLSAEEGLRVRL